MSSQTGRDYLVMPCYYPRRVMGLRSSEPTSSSRLQIEEDIAQSGTNALGNYYPRVDYLLGNETVAWGSKDGEGIFRYVAETHPLQLYFDLALT